MNSVDNAFQLAFLFRDGHIFFDTGSDGYPLIRPVTKVDKDSGKYESQEQFVSSLSPALWRVIKDF